MTMAPAEAARPPAWFEEMIAIEPERGTVDVAGTAIETLAWGERGKPGLLFLHGNGGHADWWRFIAPFFAKDWRVGALSWSGMGRSGWRDAYSMELHRAELLAGAEALGMFEGPIKPQIVAHSFGSAVALQVVASPDGERFGAMVVADNGARPPQENIFAGRRAWASPAYESIEAGVARFRLRPAQTCDNGYILDFIGRHSLRAHPEGGWTWCFDPDADASRGAIHTQGSADTVARARCRLSFLWGERSSLVPPEIVALTREVAPAGSRFVEIPDAAHHLMLDQPLAFVAAVRALLQD